MCPGHGVCLAELGAARAQTVAQAGVRNYVVVAIDAQLRDHLTARGINVYYKDIQVGRPRLRCQPSYCACVEAAAFSRRRSFPRIAEQASSLCRQARAYQHI